MQKTRVTGHFVLENTKISGLVLAEGQNKSHDIGPAQYFPISL